MERKLECIYDARKSFYGKAIVRETEEGSQLYSYGTKVAEIKEGKAIVHGTYSQTTLRHIREYLLQNDFEATTKKQIVEDYCN